MRGHIRKRGKKWVAVVDVGVDEKGQRKQQWKTFDKKGEAEDFIADTISKVKTGQYVMPSNMTLKEYLEFWLEQRKPKLAESTYRSYEDKIQDHILPVLGKIRLDKLNPIEIEKYYAKKLNAGLSGTTVLYHHRILHAALKYACKKKIIPFNPTDAVEAPDKNKYVPELLTAKECRAIMESVSDTNMYIPVVLSATTGMRRGEICALTWDNLNEQEAYINLKGALKRTGAVLVQGEGDEAKRKHRGGKLTIGDTKGKKHRTVALTKHTMNLLKIHKAKQKLLRGQKWSEKGFICCWEDGRPLDPDWISRKFRESCRGLGISDSIRFHDLRHGFASMLMEQKVNLKVISEILGHAEVSTTGDIYSHVNLTMQHQAIKKVDQALFGKK